MRGTRVLRAKALGFLGVVLVSSLALAVLERSRAPLLTRFENVTWDLRLGATADRRNADPRIKIITIDQRSLDGFAADDITWPCPREFYAHAIHFLRKGGAKGVAIDMLFTDPSRVGVEDDEAFARSLSGPLPVVIAVPLSTNPRDVNQEQLNRFIERQNSVAIDREVRKVVEQKTHFIHFEGITLPIGQLLAEGKLFGNVSHHSERDGQGVFRHAKIGGEISQLRLLDLPFALCAGTECREQLKKSLERFDGKGSAEVRFHGPEGTYQTFSFGDVVRSDFALEQGETPPLDPEVFRGAWVFLGVSALGLVDFHPSPLDPKFPGVEYNAAVFDNVLNNEFVRRPNLAQVLCVGLLFIVVAAAGSIFPHRLRIQMLFAVTLIAVLAYFGVQTTEMGYWFPLVNPGLSVLLALFLGLVVQYQLEGRQNRFVQRAFRHYVSPTVMEQIVADPSKLQLGGEKKELTVFFSDVAGFTSISEKLPPQDLLSLMNRYLGEMTEIVLESGGTLDKYIGDAIVAFWNAPLAAPNHASLAVGVALRCQARLRELQEEFERDFGVKVQARVGINTGSAVVGNFGSRVRFDYTVLGDNVNLAARLEGANKYFGTSILMTQATYDECRDDILARRIGGVRVVGKEKPVVVWEPVAFAREAWPERYDRYAEAQAVFEQGRIDEALKMFEPLSAEDSVAQAYVSRIRREGQNRGADGKQFSPDWVLTDK